jgi:hypothetical protein
VGHDLEIGLNHFRNEEVAGSIPVSSTKFPINSTFSRVHPQRVNLGLPLVYFLSSAPAINAPGPVSAQLIKEIKKFPKPRKRKAIK